MKRLLSFYIARKACVALIAVLGFAKNVLSVPVWCILTVRSRLSDALENFNGGNGHE